MRRHLYNVQKLYVPLKKGRKKLFLFQTFSLTFPHIRAGECFFVCMVCVLFGCRARRPFEFVLWQRWQRSINTWYRPWTLWMQIDATVSSFALRPKLAHFFGSHYRNGLWPWLWWIRFGPWNFSSNFLPLTTWIAVLL